MLENYLFPQLEHIQITSYTSGMVPCLTGIFMWEFMLGFLIDGPWSDHADFKFIQYLRHCSVILTMVTQINCYFQVAKVSKKYLKCTSLSLTFERWSPLQFNLIFYKHRIWIDPPPPTPHNRFKLQDRKKIILVMFIYDYIVFFCVTEKN